MCQSKEQGGRRCEHAYASSREKAKLKDLIRYHRKQGHTEELQELEEKLSNLKNAEDKYGKCISPFKMNINEPTEKLLSDMKNMGFDPLIVGGSVRDYLNGSESKDIDIEVYGGNIHDISTQLSQRGYNVDEVGKSFGVLKTVLKNGDDIDISVPRKESKTGEGHKGFEVNTDEELSIEEASSRRDYTINAMMYSHEHQVLVDPHNGRNDFQEGKLRHVSEAFADDPLRVMRGFQFASRFRVSMAPETAEMGRSLRSEAQTLAEERMKTEWDKFYTKGTCPSKGLEVLQQTQWDSVYSGLKEINNGTLHNYVDEAYYLTHSKAPETKRRVQSAVIASQMNDEDAKEFTQRTNLTLKEGKQAYALAKTQSRGQILTDTLTLANDLAENNTTIEEWSLVQKAQGKNVDSIVAHAEKANVFTSAEEPFMSGGAIIEQSGKTPGKWVGQLHNEFKKAQANREFSNKEEAQGWVKRKLMLDNMDEVRGKIVLTHGLPASGKTSWAKDMVQAHPNDIVRVNRDDIRAELYGDYLVNGGPVDIKKEKKVTEVSISRVKENIANNKTVIMDNTNLNRRDVVGNRKLAQELGTTTAHVYFPTNVEECKRRNSQRDRVVPEIAYEKMIGSGFKNGKLKKAYTNSRGEFTFE